VEQLVLIRALKAVARLGEDSPSAAPAGSPPSLCPRSVGSSAQDTECTTPAGATAALAVALIAMPAAMAASHPATSHSSPPHTASAARASRTPGLAITISDGRVAARAGDKLTYTVSVRNSGAVAVRRVKVTQTLSPGLEFLSASEHGVAAGGDVSWTATLPVGGKRTFVDVTRVVCRCRGQAEPCATRARSECHGGHWVKQRSVQKKNLDSPLNGPWLSSHRRAGACITARPGGQVAMSG
jgi:uncharacterized repeat protein (TIGR01451 family)